MANPWDNDPIVSKAAAQPWDSDPIVKPAAKLAAQQKDVGALDLAKAGVTGLNKGFFSDLLGLPVDTAANVIDLVKAGAGSAYIAATGKPPAAILEPYDRSKVAGSSDWIAARLNDAGLGGAINNPNPQDAASRIIHTGGRVAGASVVPVKGATMSAGQQATNAGMGALSGVVSGTVGEVAPEYAGLAGMMPSLGVKVGSSAIKRTVRGGETGRQAMAQRIQDLRDGGIDSPSVGLASGNRGVMGLENILAQTPFSAGLYDTARQNNIAGMQGKTNRLRDAISPEFGPVVAGEAIQSSIKGPFVERFKTNQNKLYNAVDDMIPDASKTQVPATTTALEELTSGIQGAPNLGNRFINGRISDINDAFRVDAGIEKRPGPVRTYSFTDQGKAAIPGLPGRPSSTVTRTIDPHGQRAGEGAPKAQRAMNAQNTPRNQILPVSALPRTVSITTPAVPASPGVPARPSSTVTRTIDPQNVWAGEGTWRPAANPSLPYQAVSKLRTQVGQELDGNMLTSDVPRSQWKKLYGSLSQDIGGAAAATSPEALAAWERANRYTRTGVNRLDDLGPLANRDTPEGAFNSVSSSLKAGPSVYERLRGALTPEARGKVVATVVDELGAAPAGQQGADGNTWSPRTFLTNYNKLHENGGGNALFKRLPGGEQHSDNLASIAKTADMLGDASKVWSNPSGTAPALTARGTIYTLTAGAFFQPVLAATTAGGLLGANQLSKRLLLNPKFVGWLAKAPTVNPEQAQAYAQRLIATANMTNDESFKRDAKDYLRLVEDESQQH